MENPELTTATGPVQKIRILYLIDKLMPAGTQVNLLEIIKRLDRNRFDPRIIALVGGGELEDEFETAGVSPIVLRVGKVYGPSGLKALSYLTRYMKKEKIDIVQTYFLHADILGSLAGKSAGVKRIITTRRDEGFWRSKRQLMLNRYFNRFADRMLANSAAVRESVYRSEKVSSRKLHVIHNGVDTGKFYSSDELRKEIRLELGIRNDEFVIGMVANMRHTVKGHRFLIKALSLLDKSAFQGKLLLVGDGPLESKLEYYAASKGVLDQILFLGSRRDINPLLNAMDIVCVPSLSEGFSNTVLEAMAAEKPLIATNVGGNPEVVTDGETGFLVRPRDGKAIAEKILFLFQNEKVRSEMGAAALCRIQNDFTAERMVKLYEEFYEDLLTRRLRSRAQRLKKQRDDRAISEAKDRTLSPQRSIHPTQLKRRIPQRVRVLYLIWSLDFGGAEQVVADLARKLDRQTFKPIVGCLNGKGRLAPLLEREGIKVFALCKKPGFDFFLIPKLLNLIRTERIDLIHTHLFTANLWGRLAGKLSGVPVISSEHGMDNWRKGFRLTLDRWLTPACKRIVFVSKAVKQFYMAKNGSINGKSRVIYNGINVANFQVPDEAQAVRESLGLNDQNKVIGIVGRLVPEKAHVDFIEAIQLLKEKHKSVVGLVVGEGELMNRLKKRVQDAHLQNHIVFTGFRSDMPRLYQAMDVCVLSSLREGFPLTVLESMAAGIPVVATKVGGVVELIEDGKDGLLISPGDSPALVEAIRRILEDQELKSVLVQNAKEKVRDYFSIEKMVNDHASLYTEVLTS